MDEAPEFPRHVLDSLRQPLESGRSRSSRSAGSVTFPARFMLVLAANPCPCAQPSATRRRVPVHSHGPPPLPGQALRPVARPHRHEGHRRAVVQA